MSIDGKITQAGAGAGVTFGSGGAAGNGGAVVADSYSTIYTGAFSADGILAQSIGGGGGYGGFSVTGEIKSDLGMKVGATNGGGSATTVAVVSTGNITTIGDQSQGIQAQSIGGGGGDGAYTIKGAVAVTGGVANGLNIGLGKSGGNGGDAGNVSINSSATYIATSGISANGIEAQSIGGGGGNGGFVASGRITPGVGIGLSVGGSGGTGGNAGTVSVTNSSIIQTTGDLADGIFAQSVGGGGGNGGFAMNIIGAGSSTGQVVIGGAAGAASSASTVTVTNSGQVTTAGENAVGIFAQSIGGGGGNGGLGSAGS
jgi:hypothetical protein